MENLNSLLPISENNGKKAVNARALHSFLEAKRDFSTWIKDRIDKYDFVENQDFVVFPNFGENPKGGRPQIEYALSIGMAKELSMVEGNEKGKQARKYFIACEESRKELSRKEILMIALKAEEEKEQLALENKALQEDNERKHAKIAKLQPKADFADKAFDTSDKVDIGMAAKILKLGFGRNTLFKRLKELGVFFSNRNEPKQRFIDAGYFEMTEKFIERSNHPGFVVTKVLVTQKGLAYINHLLGGDPGDGKITRIV